MTIAKTELFSLELQLASSYFKILSHPARIAILKFLSGTKVCMTGDICEELPLSRTTVTQHLKELKEAGLIKGEIEGVKFNYCLDLDKIKDMELTINKFISDLKTFQIQNC